jgi:hypothetical protein
VLFLSNGSFMIRIFYFASFACALFASSSFAFDKTTFYCTETGSEVDDIQQSGTQATIMDYATGELGHCNLTDMVPSVPSLGDLTTNSKVLYLDPDTGKYKEGEPSHFFANGIVLIPEPVIVQGDTAQYTSKVYHYLDQRDLIREVPSLQGIRDGDELCTKGDGRDGLIDRIYQNGMATVEFGDFFGKRFAIFHHSETLPLSDLGACALPERQAGVSQQSAKLHSEGPVAEEPAQAASGASASGT